MGPVNHDVELPVSFKKLLDNWRETAAAPRTVTEYAVRLPVDDAAQLQALTEMFPGRTAEQLITDLLGVALQEIATAMPYVAGQKVISTDEQGDPVYEDVGPTPRFMELARRNRKKLEAEARNAAATNVK
jgi:hypothetical protein